MPIITAMQKIYLTQFDISLNQAAMFNFMEHTQSTTIQIQ